MSRSDASQPLTIRHQRAIAAMVSTSTLEAAAKTAGLSRRTLHRYCEDPEFREAVQEANRLAYEEALYRAHAAAGTAISALTSILESRQSKASDRVAAARVLLDQANRMAEKLERRDRAEAEFDRWASDPMERIRERLEAEQALDLAKQHGIPFSALVYRGAEMSNGWSPPPRTRPHPIEREGRP